MNFLLPLLEPKKTKKKQKTKAKNKSSIQGVWFVNVEEKADKEERIKLKRTSRLSKTRAVTWGLISEQFCPLTK